MDDSTAVSAPGRRGAVLHYGATIFVSAFLLFQVQPIIARLILPWFGGSAAVWTTCLLFFQTLLLGGYLYAHWLVGRMGARRQWAVHATLLAASLLTLPIVPAASWKPSGVENPTLQILGLLAVSLGLPYFLLSATSPLIQAWYARSYHGVLPYRLFALSNFASLTALLSYPVLVEPFLATRRQAQIWSGGYAVFVVLCIAAAIRGRASDPAAPADGQGETGDDAAPGWTLHVLWMLLPACASALLLAVTNYLTQDVAAIPFLWVLPLSLYLLSFVFSFDASGWYRRALFYPLLAGALGFISYQLMQDEFIGGLRVTVTAFAAGFFVCAMVCHGELARVKPHPRHLTSFYLMISVGGALGGVFVGLVAPYVFPAPFELPIALLATALAALWVLYRDTSSPLCRGRMFPVWVVLVGLSGGLCGVLWNAVHEWTANTRVLARNFYGGLRVRDEGEPGSIEAMRKILHGAINHGQQWLDAGRSRRPASYYCEDSGAGLAIASAARRSGDRVGIIGLGAGTLATYGRHGDYYKFYEINPLVLDIARREFTFLKDSQARVDVVLGDARLSMEREPPQAFDVLVVDAFSGDSIPVHLLTREAFALYFRHLKPDGALAVHVSNRYIDLRPVVRMAAAELRKTAREIDTDEEDEDRSGCFGATWVLMAGGKEYFDQPTLAGAAIPLAESPKMRVWTDDYSNLFQLLK